MNQLKALTTYLLERKLVPAGQLRAWAQQLDLQLAWTQSEQGLHMGNLRYRALFDFDDFSGHPGRLMALAGSWLEAHDPGRHLFALPAPTIAIKQKVPGSDLLDVSLALEFVEPLYLTEDAAGEIEVFGKTWSFQPYDLWVAEQGDIALQGLPLGSLLP
ncbi:phage tail protein [Pseudomonas entomophila]|uniref:phage tail protein n=1 Tax=Pseudomonas entomophila TaxID=312306 RepID=UPI001F0192A8|nr:phage tail protein [Pseudomonas entomophila]MCG8295777.1 phage tail protein [Pseudomonas entomophila]